MCNLFANLLELHSQQVLLFIASGRIGNDEKCRTDFRFLFAILFFRVINYLKSKFFSSYPFISRPMSLNAEDDSLHFNTMNFRTVYLKVLRCIYFALILSLEFWDIFIAKKFMGTFKRMA